MAILTVRVPEVKDEAEGRPGGCPNCASSVLQGWGSVAKSIRDTNGMRTVRVRRYRCCGCGRTFRHYPAGITGAMQTRRLEVVAAMLWAMGLSLRGAKVILAVLGTSLSHQTVWRDGIALGRQAAARRARGPVRVLGVDGTGARLAGRSSGVVVAVDMGTGRPVAFVELDERDPQAVRLWLAPLVEQLGVEVLVTDDLGSYRSVCGALHVEHGTCLFHTKRWVGRALKELADQLDAAWQPTLEDIADLLDDLPADGGYRLMEAAQQVHAPPPMKGEEATPDYRLKVLMIRLSQSWHRILLHQRRPDVPTTNNRSEQAIGRFKTRVKTMRGLKSARGREAIFHLAQLRLVA